MTKLTRSQLGAYGALGLPLAMAALPLYVHLPKLYGGDLGMPLALVGGILLLTRLADAVSDPVLGWLADRWPRRERFTAAALPLLAAGMIALLHPGVAASGLPLAAWLAGWLIVTYLGFSMASIAYQAWGAQLAGDAHERTRVTAAREIFTLVGVVVAAAAPGVLGGENATGLGRFAFVFAGLLAVCAAVTLALAPRPPHRSAPRAGLVDSVAAPLANREYRRLLAVFMLSGIAAAIPSTLVLFFIADVLQAADLTGLFLVIYFVAGALGIPLWVVAAKRFGKENAWIAGMIVAVVAFVWAWQLGPGDVVAYGVICALSGLALGADLALPASILADVIDRDRRGPGAVAEGSYFGIWNLVTKANLAIAAGLALPVLGALGYAPGQSGAERSLAFVYCLLPCVLKLGSAAVLWLVPVRGPLPLAKGLT
jgi:Na+/melibiose symporter-like transporter